MDIAGTHRIKLHSALVDCGIDNASKAHFLFLNISSVLVSPVVSQNETNTRFKQ